MSNAKKIPARNEVDKNVCWSIEDLFPSDQAWTEAFEALKTLPEEIAVWQGRLGESARTLYDYLSFSEDLSVRVEPVSVYAFLRSDEDTADADHQAMYGQCMSLMVRISSAAAFEGPELAAIPQETLDLFYTQVPELEKYRRFLDRARLERDHILSHREEELLAGAGEIAQAPGSIFQTLADADMKFPPAADSQGGEHAVTNGTYISLMESADRTLRKNAFTSLYGVYGGFRNTLAATLNAEVRKNAFFARARKYPTALAAALGASEVPEAVYHSLIDAVHNNLDKMYRYMALRKKALGVDELHMYDIYTPIVPGGGEVIPFQRAKEEVLASLQVLGEDYCRVVEESFRQRWMDIYENEGKRSGAYSCGCRVHPFLLLNHTDDLNSEFTLAHELGHAMHSYRSNRNQPPVYADYVLFGKTEDRKKRAVLINYFLEQFRTTVYRQTMFAEFELETHRLSEAGETLTAARLCDIYSGLNRLYYGEDVVQDGEIAMEWARIPHFYRRFYVYQYATGFSAAMALSRRILEGGPEAVADYLRFLGGGSSADPLTLLKEAGVDLSTPEPVEDALALFGQLTEEMEGLLAAR